MASKKNEIRFKLTNEDYRAFGRYRIMYTEQGRKMVNRQRFTYIFSGAMIALLFTLFHVDRKFTYLMYAIAAVMVIGGIFFAEKMLLKQQDKAIVADENTAERVHAAENFIRFDEDTFTTSAGSDTQTFSYKDIKLIDLTEEAIYVWMSDTAIMPLPLHAFADMKEMKAFCKWLREKNAEQSEKTAE